VSDTITLVAGVLLTSVGLLALLPFVLRLGRRSRDTQGLQIDAAFLPALAAADAVMRPDIEVLRGPAPEEPSSVNDDMEELMAHLFSLRMTLSEVTAEVQDVHEALFGENVDAMVANLEPEDIATEQAVEHAA
jgi:hypothetical protein